MDTTTTIIADPVLIGERPVIWTEELAPPVPYLVPNQDGEPMEVVDPTEKPTQKLKWADDVELCEIENRYQLEEKYPEDDDEDSYEIEIVEDDGDADFYLEIVDGEIFYVFETEDDDSMSSEEDDSDEMQQSDSDSNSSSSSEESSSYGEAPTQPLQLNIGDMLAPPLDFDDDAADKKVAGETLLVATPAAPSFDANSSMASFNASFMDFGDGEDSDESDNYQGDGADASVDEQSEASSERKPPVPAQTDKKTDLSTTTSLLDQTKEEPSRVEPEIDAQLDKTQQTDVTPTAPAQEEGVVVTPTSSPVSVPKEKCLSPPQSFASPTDTSPVKSILKACPPSPKSPAPERKQKKSKQKKTEKTVTKRYVRADNFDGEQMVFAWEKPKWTDKKLKETSKGADVRSGANLANPITFPKKKPTNESLMYEDDKGNTIDKDELISRIQAGDSGALAFVPAPTYEGKHQRKLKCSLNGQKLRQGQDLAKPVTMATVNRKRDDVNHLANKTVLRNKVQTVRRQYSWEQPEWAIAKLRSSEKGAAVKKGESVAAPITKINEIKKKEYAWEKPEWTKPKLSATRSGEILKNGQDLQKSITRLPESAREKRRPTKGTTDSSSADKNSGDSDSPPGTTREEGNARLAQNLEPNPSS